MRTRLKADDAVRALFGGFLGDDVDDATHGRRTLQGNCPLDDLDPVDKVE